MTPSLRSRIHRLQIIELLTIRQNTEIWRRRHHRPVRTGQNLYNMTELYLLYIHVFRRFCQVLLCNRCRAELVWSRHQWFTVILAGIKAQDAAAEPMIYSSNLSLHHASWAELKPASSSSSSSSSRRRHWGGIRGGESSGSEQQRSRFLQINSAHSGRPTEADRSRPALYGKNLSERAHKCFFKDAEFNTTFSVALNQNHISHKTPLLPVLSLHPFHLKRL